MEGKAQPLIKFFDGSDKRFIIPLYQRNYDWKEENCARLFEDLIKLHKNNRRSHFFGSIVSVRQSDTEDILIIDGQQRITTVSLLLIALVNAYKEGKIIAQEQKLAEKIFKRYLVDEYQEDERKVKLKPIKRDMEAFDALLYKPTSQYIKESNVTRNYNFLYDKAIGCGQTLDELFDAIKKLEVINITLNEDDDPQLIFESLNSTGLDLSEADKIRNYLLMSLTPAEQEELYTKYWNPIEIATKYDPSPFVRDYLTMKQGKIGKSNEIYFIFKEYAEPHDRIKLLSDLYHYAQIYSRIDSASFEDDRINLKIKQIRTLDFTTAYPFYMAFFDYAESSEMSVNETIEVLDLVESYLARRIICNLPSNALNKVFSTLHREVMNIIAKEDTKPSYIDVLTYQLLKKRNTSAFPDDNEVKENFCTRQVYKMPPNTRMFILERLENRNSKERHDIVQLLSDKNITIEHIMPQTLSAEWKQELGSEWERIHQQYLHTMANLTLTGYNTKYSNLPFARKRDMTNGFKDSAFRLNNYVKSCTEWTEKEMKERQSELLQVFMELWPTPTTSFVPTQMEVESASLDDDDFEFTGKKLQAYIYHGERYNINTWKEMLIQLCGHVLREKRSTLEWICANGKYGFSYTPATKNTEFADGLYVLTNNQTSSKLWTIQKLFSECEIPYSELTFEFRAYSGDDGDEPEQANHFS